MSANGKACTQWRAVAADVDFEDGEGGEDIGLWRDSFDTARLDMQDYETSQPPFDGLWYERREVTFGAVERVNVSDVPADDATGEAT